MTRSRISVMLVLAALAAGAVPAWAHVQVSTFNFQDECWGTYDSEPNYGRIESATDESFQSEQLGQCNAVRAEVAWKVDGMDYFASSTDWIAPRLAKEIVNGYDIVHYTDHDGLPESTWWGFRVGHWHG